MSVSQVKKKFEEFATYLGRDTAGLEKLKSLKDAVNVLRTRLAAAEANEAQAVEHAEEMAKRARAAESELADAKNETQRLQQVNQNLLRDIQIAAVRADDELDEPDTDARTPVEEMELKRVMKRLRERKRFCPLPTRIVSAISVEKDSVSNYMSADKDDFKETEMRVWDRESLAQGWSHESLWSLGAAVAVLSAFHEIVAIKSHSFRGMKVRDPDDDTSVWRQIIQWIQKTLKEDGKESEYFRKFREAGQPYYASFGN